MRWLSVCIAVFCVLTLVGCRSDRIWPNQATEQPEAHCDMDSEEALQDAVAAAAELEQPHARVEFWEAFVATHPGSAQGFLRLGAEFLNSGAYEEARASASRAIELDSASASAHTLKALAMTSLQEDDELIVEEITKGLLIVYPLQHRTWWELIRLMYHTVDHEATLALAASRELVAKKKSLGHLVHAAARFKRGEYDQAIAAANHVDMGTAPGLRREARVIQALAKIARGDDATGVWDDALGVLWPSWPAAWLSLSLDAARGGRWEEARLLAAGSYMLMRPDEDRYMFTSVIPVEAELWEHLWALTESKQDPNALLVRGLAYLELGRDDAALDAFRTAETVAPGDEVARLLAAGGSGRDAMELDWPRIKDVMPSPYD